MSQTGRATTAEQLVTESDYVQLSRLVIEHGWRVDNGRAETVHELYIDDGELTLPSGTLRGRTEIREWGRQIVDNTPWQTIRHVCGNMRFVYDGDNAAIGTTVLTVFMVAGAQASTTVPYNVGEDHDRFVRTEDGWRFDSRRWVELFTRGDTLNLPS
jgi:hypothetical protein